MYGKNIFGEILDASFDHSTQNILPTYWSMFILQSGEKLQALRLKNSWVLLKQCQSKLGTQVKQREALQENESIEWNFSKSIAFG